MFLYFCVTHLRGRVRQGRRKMKTLLSPITPAITPDHLTVIKVIEIKVIDIKVTVIKLILFVTVVNNIILI